MTAHRPTQGFEPTTPTPVVDSSERMRAIARDEGQRAAQVERSEHENACARTGHACALWDAVNELRSEQKAMATQYAEERGELRGAVKAETRQLKIIVAVIGAAGLAAQIFGLFWKARHGG